MLRDVLKATASTAANIRKDAESTILSREGQVGFTLELLMLVDSLSASTIPEDALVRQAAAVTFKNTIKRRWQVREDNDSPIPMTDRDTIKTNLVNLMCSTPKDVQKQLGEAVSIIATYDFPNDWMYLLAQLVEKLKSGDMRIILGVMSTVNSLLKRYRYSARSDALFKELKFCLEQFQEPLLHMFKSITDSLMNGAPDAQTELKLQAVYQMTRIFYSFNCQDLPEYFEDNMKSWMDEFTRYLTCTNPAFTHSNEDEPGHLERIQAAIIENLNLYAGKYEEEFTPFLSVFTQLIWKLLVEVRPQRKFDGIAVQGIKFLTSVCSKQMYSTLFTDGVLQDIVINIVVKNLTITESDEELFEDNPMDYVRMDMEGSDQETRRRCAMELVRALLKLFGEKTSQLCVSQVSLLVQQYMASRSWKLKDTAFHLVLAVSVMGTSSAQGATLLNPNVNIVDLFNSMILPELQDTNTINSAPIVKADVIKLICMFRNHLDANQISGTIFPLLIGYLKAKSAVVQTYSAICIEKFLALRTVRAKADGSGNESIAKVSKQHISQSLDSLFASLFSIVEGGSQEQAENDNVMKCIMRVLLVIGSDINPATEFVSNKLILILQRICKNPINPHFNHYLFECVAVVIRAGCEYNGANGLSKTEVGANCNRLEMLLFPSFQGVLAQNVSEFFPYVFQLLAQLLFYRPREMGGLSDFYKALFTPLLSPLLWEQKGNIPALMLLFQAYIIKGINTIAANEQSLLGILGIFQKLLSVRSTEADAFALLTCLFRYCSYATIEKHVPVILKLVLDRMMHNKIDRTFRHVVHMICVFVNNYDANLLYQILESFQPGLFLLIVEQVYFGQIDYIARTLSGKISLHSTIFGAEIVIGTAKILTSTIPVITQNTSNCWSMLMRCNVAVLCALSGTKQAEEANVETTDEFTAFSKMLHSGQMGGEAELLDDNAYSKLNHADIPLDYAVVINGKPWGEEALLDIPLSSDTRAASLDTVSRAAKLFAFSLGGLMKANPGKYASVLFASFKEKSEADTIQAVFAQNNVPVV